MKRIILLVLLSFSILLMWQHHSFMPVAYRSTDLEKVETDNGVAYMKDGVLTNAADLHYAYFTRMAIESTVEPTEIGNTTIIETYFDEQGKPAKQKYGHYALKRVYEGKDEVQTIYLNEKLAPITNTSGYCEKRRECQDGHVSRDAKNENSVSQGENGVLTRIQKSSGYSPEA